MTDTWLISLGAGRWQIPGIQAARRAELSVLALDGDAHAPGLQEANRSMVVDIRDAQAVVSAIESSGIKPSGAISFCNEAGIVASATLREKFKLPGFGIEVAHALTNKGIQRKKWTEAGLPCPAWRVVHHAADVPGVLKEIGGTVIFKPVDSAGSRGITVLKASDPWENAFEHARNVSLTHQVIIESFIVGIEHTVETFSHGGETFILAITSKRKVPGTSNTVANQLATVQMDNMLEARIRQVCTDALRALGYRDGPGHTEVLVTEDKKVYLVESAGRGGGFMVADGLVPMVSGFDLATATALQSVGRPVTLPQIKDKMYGVLRFIASRPGKITGIHGFDSSFDVPDVVCGPIASIGQVVGRAMSDGDRFAYIISVAGSPEEASRLADIRESRIRFELEVTP